MTGFFMDVVVFCCRSCVTDMCDCPAGRQCSCESIRAYAHECARAGFEIDWEKDSACTTLGMCDVM